MREDKARQDAAKVAWQAENTKTGPLGYKIRPTIMRDGVGFELIPPPKADPMARNPVWYEATEQECFDAIQRHADYYATEK